MTTRTLAITLGLTLGSCLGAVACSGDDGGRDTGSSGISDSGTAGEGGDGASDGPAKFDITGGGTGMATAEGGSGDGCEKVDFLFVIDSSGSMYDEQQNLLNSFPGFITAIEQTLEFNDFHLMVVDAGLVAGTDCDGTLGAGLTKDSLGTDCGLVGGRRFADQAQPDLEAAFTCMASRGSDGPGNEQTMDSMMAAIGPLNAMGQCNEGFVRDDAILVVTIITDEEDSPADVGAALDGSCAPADSDTNSVGDPATWRQAVVDAKLGNGKAAVVLSLIGDCDAAGMCSGIEWLDQLDPTSITGAEPAPRVREFTNLFHFGSTGPVCADDYSPFFEEAVSVIGNACDEYTPPG